MINKEEECYFLNNKGILMHKYKWDYDVVNQIILPYALRGKVLKLVHDVPARGHLDITKTRNRLLRYFFWPNFYKDASNYVKTCDM